MMEDMNTSEKTVENSFQKWELSIVRRKKKNTPAGIYIQLITASVPFEESPVVHCTNKVKLNTKIDVFHFVLETALIAPVKMIHFWHASKRVTLRPLLMKLTNENSNTYQFRIPVRTRMIAYQTHSFLTSNEPLVKYNVKIKNGNTSDARLKLNIHGTIGTTGFHFLKNKSNHIPSNSSLKNIFGMFHTKRGTCKGKQHIQQEPSNVFQLECGNIGEPKLLQFALLTNRTADDWECEYISINSDYAKDVTFSINRTFRPTNEIIMIPISHPPSNNAKKTIPPKQSTIGEQCISKKRENFDSVKNLRRSVSENVIEWLAIEGGPTDLGPLLNTSWKAKNEIAKSVGMAPNSQDYPIDSKPSSISPKKYPTENVRKDRKFSGEKCLAKKIVEDSITKVNAINISNGDLMLSQLVKSGHIHQLKGYDANLTRDTVTDECTGNSAVNFENAKSFEDFSERAKKSAACENTSDRQSSYLLVNVSPRSQQKYSKNLRVVKMKLAQKEVNPVPAIKPRRSKIVSPSRPIPAKRTFSEKPNKPLKLKEKRKPSTRIYENEKSAQERAKMVSYLEKKISGHPKFLPNQTAKHTNPDKQFSCGPRVPKIPKYDETCVGIQHLENTKRLPAQLQNFETPFLVRAVGETDDTLPSLHHRRSKNTVKKLVEKQVKNGLFSDWKLSKIELTEYGKHLSFSHRQTKADICVNISARG